MRFITATATLLTLSNAFPITIDREIETQCDEELLSRITQFELSSHLTSFTIPFENNSISPSDASRDDGAAESTAYEFLDFQLQIPFCDSADDQSCLELELNDQHIFLDGDELFEGYRVAASHVNLVANDHSGSRHSVDLVTELHTVTEQIDEELGQTYKQFVTIVVEAIDDRPVERQAITFTWKKWPEQGGLTKFLQIVFEKGDKLDYSCIPAASDTSSPAAETDMAYDEKSINDEIEALQLLQQHALQLENEIKTRKSAIALAQARLHTKKPLDQIIQECDGMVCAAQALLTRINDKITLATTTETSYSKLQDVMSDGHGSDAPPSYHYLNHHNMTSHNFTGDFGTNEGYLVKALTCIATLLGVIALFAFIKRKCMSIRTRVERAADREERRNARAYRRAARRAFVRKRWTGFFKSISCFGTKPERMTDYDEKRALILQDALLEQDFDQAEKGQVMEAQIRELRNAHHIVSSILQRREPKPLSKDPPPPHVPLPQTPEVRSRSSTSTLPSYDSASLPDYSSIPEPTGNNATTDGFAYYVPSSSTSDQAHHSTSYSIQSRSTPISSVAGLSPRASAETLRTRYSKITDKS